jgi:hypothetical protein
MGSIGQYASGSVLKVSNNDLGGNRYIRFAFYGDGLQSWPYLQSYHSQSDSNYWNFLLNPFGGSVGIGTTSPGSKLTISAGSIAVDSAYGIFTSPGTASAQGINFDTTNGLQFYTNNSERIRVNTSGNVGIGGSADRASTVGTKVLNIFDGTAPAGTLTNGISIYSSGGEAYMMDAAGNATLQTPHDRLTNEWIFYSVNTRTGKILRIDMERILRKLNEQYGGGYIHESLGEMN